jgi:hypothetical protein
MFLFLVYHKFRCSKFIHQIEHCFSAKNYFITKFTSKFSLTLSSSSIMFHTEIIRCSNVYWPMMYHTTH